MLQRCPVGDSSIVQSESGENKLNMSESEGANNVKGIDLGWNDPPMFTFDSRQVYTNVKKPALTKRVGLSWDSSCPAPSTARLDESVLPASAPPRGPIPGPPPPSVLSKASSNGDALPPTPSAPPCEDEPAAKDNTTSCPSEARPDAAAKSNGINLDTVSKSLNELANELFGDKEREKAEINKRLSLVDSMWLEDKFPVDLKEKLHKISEALKTGDVDEADKLQRGLMIDHSALCSTWMAAIRKLISVKRQDTGS